MSKSPESKNNVSSSLFPLFIVIMLPLSLMLCPFFTTVIHAASVTLSWDANTEPDLAGYRIYYSKTSGGYTTSNRLNVAESQTSVTITGLTLYTRYYFVATAYNTDGYESDYSNEVTTITSTSGGSTAYASGGGGGGGGGGCFIATAACGSEMSNDFRLLKKFRDNYLLKTSPGRLFVNFYYRISPPIAQ